jgi:hypothetical protein
MVAFTIMRARRGGKKKNKNTIKRKIIKTLKNIDSLYKANRLTIMITIIVLEIRNIISINFNNDQLKSLLNFKG